MKTHKLFLLFFITVSLSGCFSSKNITTIVGGQYDEAKDETDYFVIPYGSVTFPGKWTKTNYQGSSRQQYFINTDSVSVSVAFGLWNQFTFNRDGSKKGIEFLRSFYAWESKYMTDTLMMNVHLIEMDSTKQYCLYRIFDKKNEQDINVYQLMVENNGRCSNISISTPKWGENEKIAFLKKVNLAGKP